MNDTEAELQSRAAEYEQTQPATDHVDADAARRADAHQVRQRGKRDGDGVGSNACAGPRESAANEIMNDEVSR